MIKKYKWDFGVLFLILLLILFFYGINLHQEKGAYLTITKEGAVLDTLPLSENIELLIGEADRGQDYNFLVIQDGKAAITSANCRDQLCVHQKAISKAGQSIICLPHKLVISVHSQKEDTLDAVTN